MKGAAAIASLAFALFSPIAAQSLGQVVPVEPAAGASVGAKPLLKIRVEADDVDAMTFRIALSRDGFRTEAFVFDQREDANGWAWVPHGDERGVVYRVRTPLAEGVWEWKVWVWNGIEWTPGERSSSFAVDVVPPADVDGVEMSLDRARGKVELRWAPVVTDRFGRPERVRKYHVYRWEKKTFFAPMRVFGIGESETNWFEDADARVRDSPVLFYMVVAEDEAGNEAGRRY